MASTCTTLTLTLTLTLSDTKKWHPDVQVYAVHDTESEAYLGAVYLDLFSRDGKFGHQMVVPLSPSYVDAHGEEVCDVQLGSGSGLGLGLSPTCGPKLNSSFPLI